MKISGAIHQTPILGSLHSRVYSTSRQLTPPLSEGARAQIMTRGPLALSTALQVGQVICLICKLAFKLTSEAIEV